MDDNESLPGPPGVLGIRSTHLDTDYVEVTLLAPESHLVPGENLVPGNTMQLVCVARPSHT